MKLIIDIIYIIAVFHGLKLYIMKYNNKIIGKLAFVSGLSTNSLNELFVV